MKKIDVDSFTPGRTSWIPYCHLRAKFNGDLKNIPDLERSIKLDGTTDEVTLRIDYSPSIPNADRSGMYKC